ncbi:hypothetical protein F52700_9449 [Fusarium sp. NRRL 52700]|nr:hypothetical protein F52700_9449 [Fusarium sp. NRRL 52700]
MGGHYDVAPINSKNPGNDEPINVMLATIRAEALQAGAEVLNKLAQIGVDQASLKLGLDMWLSEPYIRVMPRIMKIELFSWCDDHSPSWCELISSCMDDDREFWVQETEVPADSNLTISQGGGSDFLRLYGQLANQAFNLNSSNPEEARRLMDRVCNGIKLFAAKDQEKEARHEEARRNLVQMGTVLGGLTENVG